MSLEQWINDRRWAANVRRARAYRRGLSFSKRVAFDEAIRPHVKGLGVVIDYPDAIYHIGIDDLCRAMTAAHPTLEGGEPVHRATESANTPIGQDTPEDAAP